MAPADGVEAVLELVLVDHGRERADLFELFGWGHQDATVGAQPSPIVETVHGDEANAGGDMVFQPAGDGLAFEVLAVRVTQREIVATNAAICVIGHADAADVTAAPRPS